MVRKYAIRRYKCQVSPDTFYEEALPYKREQNGEVLLSLAKLFVQCVQVAQDIDVCDLPVFEMEKSRS